jgi:hypothetical protein
MIELKALQGQVKALVEDLRGQVAADPELRSGLVKEYEDAKAGQRTGGTFESWLEDPLDQAAVAWVLGCVFVRFCEDNGLVDGLWLGGPEPDAPVERAVQNRQACLIANPRHNDRHWLREAFGYLRSLRATGKLFDDHNPVWRFGISGQAAEDLSDFFRRGDGLRSLRSPGLDTRFLGDLYQDLSARARQMYALLQTPVFVEEFILDRAFEPAYREFGLAGTTVIDPTCGSGHFLLGAFRRLVTRWKEREPGTDVRELVQRALHQVTGVDINPFAVAIARFRLMVAALNACRLSSLERAPAFDVRVATGDSLLPWAGEAPIEQPDLLQWRTEKPFAYTSEDEDLLADYLKPHQHTVVVGNPPYNRASDPARNQKYRELYSACSGRYALTVPFAQRFFQLASRGDKDGDGAGYVGQITANSFMKREFGKKLIESFFDHVGELTEIINASKVRIPTFGYPTVILVGRNSRPRKPRNLRLVMATAGDDQTDKGTYPCLAWKAITEQVDRPGTESQWVTVVAAPNQEFVYHPWSLSGGGSNELLALLNECSDSLATHLSRPIGFASFPGQDEVFEVGSPWLRRRRLEYPFARHLVRGELVRDWGVRPTDEVLVPFDCDDQPLPFSKADSWARHLWLFRVTLQKTSKVEPGGGSNGVGVWWTWYRWVPERYKTPLSITFPELETHNHFALDKGHRVFNQTAPVIKLSKSDDLCEHMALLGALNSSTTCFWLKEVSQNKGQAGYTSMGGEPWKDAYQIGGTRLRNLPLPATLPSVLGEQIDDLARRMALGFPVMVVGSGTPTRQRLAEARRDYHATRARMIALQEELDWEVYRLYGLLNEDLTTDVPPKLRLGERAFEILMARKGVQTEWFSRHGSTPITELPAEWPDEYKALVERRIAIIESDRNIGLIERPECKRRWATEGWDAMQAKALRDWLLDRLEAPELWGGAPTPLSVAQLADRVRHDEDFRSVLDLWVGSDQHDLVKTLCKLVADLYVPFLPAQRYKPGGLRKRAQWERTWRKQRQEDAGEKVDIDVPPKYTSADFVKGSYWQNRKSLDVPKERFISYQGLGREGDGTMLLGWAGWDHLAQAQALATVYLDRKTQGAWPGEKLLPILAGLAELEPWLKQWHAEPRSGFPGTPAQFFAGLIDTELAALGADRTKLTELRGVEELV